MELTQIDISEERLDGLPLFFRKIHYNTLADINEEYKLIRYNHSLQSNQMSYSYAKREISKTIDYSQFYGRPDDKAND